MGTVGDLGTVGRKTRSVTALFELPVLCAKVFFFSRGENISSIPPLVPPRPAMVSTVMRRLIALYHTEYQLQVMLWSCSVRKIVHSNPGIQWDTQRSYISPS